MNDLLTIEETAEAADQGWLLQHVYDQGLKRWAVMVLPLQFGTAHLPTADAAGAFVVALARQGHTLAIKALRLVMASHAPVTKGKK